MKKILLIISLLIITTGCSNINKMDYKDIIDNTIKSNENNKFYNTFHNGYKYYLPKYMSIKSYYNYNEIINSKDYSYYLYVNIIGYYKNKSEKYNKKNEYMNYEFELDKKNGNLTVYKENDRYLVDILYNYAKIEVIVEKKDINEAINNSIIILSTIKYDDEIIKNLITENKINSSEETLNIFDKTKNKKSDFLDIIEEYDTYDEKSDIPDYDIIN